MPAKTTSKTAADQPFEFEPALKELESITTWFESSDADLDQGLAKFERGMELAAALKDHLTLVENKIEKIKLKFESPAAEPKPTAASAPAETPAAHTTQAAPQDFDRSFTDDEAKSNGEVPGSYPRVGLFS